VTIITDGMVGRLFQERAVDLVLVGADRIAANGDVANKIGTYTIAALAARHDVPFYVCAPTSTIDLDTADGSAIPIEERDPDEVLYIAGKRVAPEGVSVYNPAFDVTPAELIAGIVTENGVARPPYTDSLAAACSETEAEEGAIAARVSEPGEREPAEPAQPKPAKAAPAKPAKAAHPKAKPAQPKPTKRTK